MIKIKVGRILLSVNISTINVEDKEEELSNLLELIRKYLDKIIDRHYYEIKNPTIIESCKSFDIYHNIYVIENNEVYTYDINAVLSWDDTITSGFSIDGPSRVDRIEILEKLLNVVENVGNMGDLETIKKKLKYLNEY